jgi:hypothetical protein
MDNTAQEEHPQLFELLQEQLSMLGLDQDTYGPYVLGVAKGGCDEEELGDVVQLLQASSESHGNDDRVWEQLTQDIVSKMTLNEEYRNQQQQESVQRKKADLDDQWQKAKLEEQQQQKGPNEVQAAAAAAAASKTKTFSVNNATK